MGAMGDDDEEDEDFAASEEESDDGSESDSESGGAVIVDEEVGDQRFWFMMKSPASHPSALSAPSLVFPKAAERVWVPGVEYSQCSGTECGLRAPAWAWIRPSLTPWHWALVGVSSSAWAARSFKLQTPPPHSPLLPAHSNLSRSPSPPSNPFLTLIIPPLPP